MDDPSTHSELDPDILLKAGSSDKPNRNQVYCISNTIDEDLQTTRNVSTIGCLTRSKS
jgi:hypothetical protein